MKKYAVYLFSPVLLCLLLTIFSCNCEEACSAADWKISLQFLSLNKNNADYVFIKKYAKTGNFSQVVDSATYYSNSMQLNKDVTTGNEYYSLDFFYDNASDYEVTIAQLSGGKWTGQLSEIKFKTEDCKSCSKRFIINTLDSYVLSGYYTQAQNWGVIPIP